VSRDGSRLVYSSGPGRICPDCGKPTAGCVCRRRRDRGGGRSSRQDERARSDPRDGVVRVRRETKGRKGKTVTTVTGVPLAEAALRDLAADLKRRCGSGGAAKGGVIEIQGDHAEVLVSELEGLGYTVKRAGG